MDPRVLDAMLPYLTDQYGNPHSRTHAYGWEAEKAVDDARQVRHFSFSRKCDDADQFCSTLPILLVQTRKISFLPQEPRKQTTWLSKVSLDSIRKRRGMLSLPKPFVLIHVFVAAHTLISVQEHKCVLDSCRKLQEEGFEVTYLPVQHNGIIRLDELEAAIRPDTSLVSIMTVNNETGVIQPIKEIGDIVRKHRGVYFHTDAAQAAGKIPLDVNEWNIDLMSISGHKLYGPKGVGAAYVRRRPRVRLEPILSGGGQERGLRSGTLPTALAVGMGEAARIAKLEMAVSSALSLDVLDDTSHANHLFYSLGASWRVVRSAGDRQLCKDAACRGTEPV